LESRLHELLDSRHWNRMVLNIYWILLLLFFLGQCSFAILIYLGGIYNLNSFIWKYMIFPDSILIVLIGGFELIYRSLHPQQAEPRVILLGTILSYISFFFIDPAISGSPMVLMLPLLISLAYFNWKALLTYTVTSVSLLIVIYSINEEFQSKVNAYEVVMYVVFYMCVAVAGIGLLSRGAELVSKLERLIVSEQQLIQENKMMDRLAKLDPLTGLYNHKTFHEYIENQIALCETGSETVHLAILDVDNFKSVNDTYGHWVGDIVLRQVAEQIKQLIGKTDFAARYGGEEFVIVFTKHSPAEVFESTETIRRAIQSLSIKELVGNHITISAGLHEYHKGEGKEGLFTFTDSLLYSAKDSGKNKTIMG
jgi:diguanylate cyclase (GGDEF)-like protein